MGRGDPPRYGRQPALVSLFDIDSSRARSERSRALTRTTLSQLLGLAPCRVQVQLFLKSGSFRVISITRLERIAALPPVTYLRGSLPRPFLSCDSGVLILEPASHLDAFSAYPFRT